VGHSLPAGRGTIKGRDPAGGRRPGPAGHRAGAHHRAAALALSVAVLSAAYRFRLLERALGLGDPARD
jgi:hypothetical protein